MFSEGICSGYSSSGVACCTDRHRPVTQASKSIIPLKHPQPQPGPCVPQDRQHQHKQKLSLSHQRHRALLFQLQTVSTLTKCQCFTILDSYKTDSMWWQHIGLCNNSGAFLCRSSMGWCRNKAGREHGESSRSTQHSVLALLCGGRACRCFWVFCQGWKVLSESQGSSLGNSTDTTDMARCTGQGMMAACAEVGVLAQVTTPARPPKVWLQQWAGAQHAGLMAQFSELEKTPPN